MTCVTQWTIEWRGADAKVNHEEEEEEEEEEEGEEEEEEES